jgi:nicotinamide mononucleotide transporter
MTSVFETIQSLGIVQILAFLSALIYIFLAAKNSILCWIFGIISSGLWAYEAWFKYSLFYDSMLNLFYVIMGGVGWYMWLKKRESANNSQLVRFSFSVHLNVLISGAIVSLLAGYVANSFASVDLPYIDAPTTVFSIIATFLLIKKDIGNWIYWIVVDAIYIGIYLYKGAYLFAFLFLIYTIMAISGWFNWRKIYQEQS